MATIGIDPILLSLGHFALRWYGLILGVAVLTGLHIATREAERRGLPAGQMEQLATWAVPAGFLGARALHVVDHWATVYRLAPWQAFAVWDGGLAVWGAVLGGALAALVYAWRSGSRFGVLADAVAPGLVLAQAMGRVACIITGDAVGPATTGPFGIAYTHPGAMVPQLGTYYVPMQVYEIVANMAIFGLLWKLRGRQMADGQLFLVYLGAYSAARLGIGFSSAYQVVGLGLTQSQIVALLGLAVALPLAAHRQWRRAEPQPAV